MTRADTSRDARSGEVERWFPSLSQGHVTEARLICFAFSGGGPSAFLPWRDAMPNWVELRALQLPGRAMRISEAPLTHLAGVLPILHDTIRTLLDVPTVFFGHSNGALIAYELARMLQSDRRTRVRHVVLSSKPAPFAESARLRRHRLSDSDLIDELRRFGGMPPELLDNAEFMAFMLPTIRADFALSETHEFDGAEKLTTPTSLWWGEDDSLVPIEEVRQWQCYLEKSALARGFTGGHFYIHSQQHSVLAEISSLLSAHRSLRAAAGTIDGSIALSSSRYT